MSGLADYDPIVRFLHILSGITWIGMLYFFNLVNLPLLKFKLTKPYEANMAEKATGPIIVKTLFWFRWGAAFTVLFGLILMYDMRSEFSHIPAGLDGSYAYALMVGILLALVMAFNVWFVIWPRQKKILANNKAIAAGTDEANKKALADANAPLVKTATMASRANTWMSIPMLWGMVMGAHGESFSTATQWIVSLVVLAVVLIGMLLYSNKKA